LTLTVALTTGQHYRAACDNIVFNECRRIYCLVCAACTAEHSPAPAENNCTIVIDAKEGSSIDIQCNMSCIAGRSILWYYSRSSNFSRPTILHNGQNPSTKTSRGISVDYNQTGSQSVLKIKDVMLNSTGIYQCSVDTADDDGCKMRFCLSTGKHLN